VACLSLVIIVCCQIEISATGRLFVQRSPSECGVSQCDLETSTIRRSRPTRVCRVKKNMCFCIINIPCILYTDCQYFILTVSIVEGKIVPLHVMAYGGKNV
jgi:hypothetical protein